MIMGPLLSIMVTVTQQSSAEDSPSDSGFPGHKTAQNKKKGVNGTVQRNRAGKECRISFLEGMDAAFMVTTI